MAEMLLDYYCVFNILGNSWSKTFPNLQLIIWPIITCVLKTKQCRGKVPSSPAKLCCLQRVKNSPVDSEQEELSVMIALFITHMLETGTPLSHKNVKFSSCLPFEW